MDDRVTKFMEEVAAFRAEMSTSTPPTQILGTARQEVDLARHYFLAYLDDPLCIPADEVTTDLLARSGLIINDMSHSELEELCEAFEFALALMTMEGP